MRFLFVLLYIVILTSCDPIVVDNSQEGQFEESNYWLTIGQINSITENIFYITILYSHEGTPANIAGFQFNMQGLHQATLLSASEGASQANNFTLSTGENTIIGFSLTGSTIPNGTNGDVCP